VQADFQISGGARGSYKSERRRQGDGALQWRNHIRARVPAFKGDAAVLNDSGI
jgi:hypothetical protein